MNSHTNTSINVQEILRQQFQDGGRNNFQFREKSMRGGGGILKFADLSSRVKIVFYQSLNYPTPIQSLSTVITFSAFFVFIFIKT